MMGVGRNSIPTMLLLVGGPNWQSGLDSQASEGVPHTLSENFLEVPPLGSLLTMTPSELCLQYFGLWTLRDTGMKGKFLRLPLGAGSPGLGWVRLGGCCWDLVMGR